MTQFIIQKPSAAANRLLVLAGLCFALCCPGCRKPAGQGGPPKRAVEAVNRGVSLMGQYQYDQAAQAFQEALQVEPRLGDAQVNLAIALFNRNRKEDMDLDRAGKLLDEVLQREPDNVRALYFKGIVLQHIGKAELALPCFQKVVGMRPDDGAAWYLLALCKLRLGQPPEEEFLRALRCRPYLYSAYYQLYQAAIRAGKAEQGKRYLDQFNTLRQSPLGESIELPQYNQMGDLALARPLPPGTLPITTARFQFKPARPLFAEPGQPQGDPRNPPLLLQGVAACDLDRDGLPDLVVLLGSPGRLLLLRQKAPGNFSDATAGSGLEAVTNALSCAFGDFDNDDVADLFVVCSDANRLFKGKGDGTFTDVTKLAGLGSGPGPGSSALFLDADHDGDLDIFVCGALANQLWNNNGDGTFSNLAARAAIACPDSRSTLVVAGDIDNDRDSDLIVLCQGRPARLFLNELLGQYREAEPGGLEIHGEAGALLQDFNGDGILDLLTLGGSPAELKLYLGDGRGHFRPSETFAETTKAAASWGPLRAFRVADVDLDGDLDIVCFGAEAHLLLNDGHGRFVVQSRVWKPAPDRALVGVELVDLTGDLVPDLLLIERGPSNVLVSLAAGELSPPSTGLAIQPTGIRSRDGRTRSPASGYGASLTVRAGLREQRLLYAGQSGGACQSWLPLIFGLGGAPKADYVSISWSDGVAQMELAMSAGQTHKLAELQRKISSCPVLFAWNGRRFEFVTDFAGVGGLGYFSAPGVSAPPQVLEHVKIEPHQLRADHGAYQLRITEPMEESAYIDRLELLAIDHPTNQPVFPDERLVLRGPLPTHQLVVVEKPLFPVRASDPAGHDCADRLARVDRIYAYEPPLDRRYPGFCQPHTLELDFGDQLASFGAQDRLFLFINGFIEYPYSQSVYAASQSRLGWEPIRIERLEPDGRWIVIVPDAGAPGGMARMMTIDLTGQITPATRKLRLTTNLEVYYDQIFLARDAGRARVQVRTVPLLEATLRRVGFAREFSPDGRLPLIYDYDLSDPTAPFHVLRGAYTRYGPVKELLAEFDDRYVVMGPGDEIALKFDAASLPALPVGQARSFVLVSHAYCKDMDLYTATPQTLEPLPFRGMSRYPYPPGEQYPASPRHQAFLKTYNTRWVE